MLWINFTNSSAQKQTMHKGKDDCTSFVVICSNMWSFLTFLYILWGKKASVMSKTWDEKKNWIFFILQLGHCKADGKLIICVFIGQKRLMNCALWENKGTYCAVHTQSTFSVNSIIQEQKASLFARIYDYWGTAVSFIVRVLQELLMHQHTWVLKCIFENGPRKRDLYLPG